MYASQLDFYYSSFKVFLPLFYFTFASLLLFLTFSFKSESKIRGETQEATPLGGHPRPRLSHSWVHQGAPLCTRPSSRARAETPQPNEDAAASGGLRHPSPVTLRRSGCMHPRGSLCKETVISWSLSQILGHMAASLQTRVNQIRLQPWEQRNKMQSNSLETPRKPEKKTPKPSHSGQE